MTQMKKLHLGINQALRGAGGGGGDTPRQPIESPDSLRSIAYARILDLVSEGEIVGFADQENPLTCVYLNETPVANADGSLNFKNIQIDSRVGTQTQDYLPNFDGVENEINIGVELRQETPWTRSITNLNLNAIRVRLSTPQMTKTNTTNGDITGSSVSYLIQLSVDGGSFNTVLGSAFSGKTTTKYERTHRIQLPPATTGWSVRVVRVTDNSESSALQNATFVESYAEIIDAKLRMPMSALVSIIVDAEQFNNIPSRAYRMRGRIIRVPSNYDPETRTYDGVWDGTFQVRYSNNPAWVFYDMALNSRYGLGHLVSNDLVDKWALYRIAQYCDQPVGDGFGGTEPRFTCNIYLQSQNDALRVMQDLATVFRGIIYANGGSITAVSDMPDDPVYTYTPANVIGGRFTYSGSGKKVRHTVALVSWTDLNDFGRAKVEYVDDEDAILRYGIQQTEVIAVGCTSRGQARRFGRYLLATERYENDTVNFSVGLDGTLAAPGKIINIADPLRAGTRRGGRLKAGAVNQVEVDMMAVSVEVGDTIIVTLPNGTIERRTINLIAGNVIQPTVNFSQAPLPQSVWAVDSETEPLQRFRVLGVGELGPDMRGYAITAIKHVPGKFLYADTGVSLELPDEPDRPSSVVPSPTGLEVTHRDVADMNTTAKVVNLSWDAVSVATSYNVLWRQSEASWVDLGTTGFCNLDIFGVLPGGFEVQVVAINSLGQRSVPTFGGPYDIPAVGTPPGYVEVINNDISQEIIDRQQADLDVATAAAIDATNKANAALAAAQAYADVIGAQLNDIIEADEWNSATAYVVGDIVQWDNKLYRAETANTNQQPDTNPDDWLLMGNYTSLGEAVAASISVGNTNASEIEAVSTQLDAVVARMPAGTGGLATQASVADEATARASADTALGNRITVVEARMPAGSGQLATASALSSLDARVTTAEGTLTSQGSAITAIQARMPAGVGTLATASAVSLLDARVTSAEGTLSTQAASITSLLANQGGGNNMLPNSGFEASLGGWSPGVNTTGLVNGTPQTSGVPALAHDGTLIGDPNFYVPKNARALLLNLNGTCPASTIYEYYSPNMPVKANTKYITSLWINNFRCNARYYIVFFDGANNVLDNPSDTQAANSISSPSFNSPTLVRRKIERTAPANSVYARVYVQIVGTGEANPYAWFIRPMVEEVPAAKTEPSAWTPAVSGLDSRYASITNLLDARVTTAEGSITAQASSITQIRSELGGGSNLLPNSGYEVDIQQWYLQDAQGGWGGGVLTRDIAGDNWRPIGMHNVGYSGAGTPNASQVAIIRSEYVAVTPNKRYMLSAFIAAHRATAYLQIIWLNAAADTVVGITSSTNNNISTVIDNGGQNLNNWRQCFTDNVQAPANAYLCYCRMVAVGNNQANPYMWMVRPMLEQVGPQQNAPSQWSGAGTGLDSKYASVTQSLTTSVTTAQNGVNTLNARYTLVLDVNGYVTGFRSENTGSTSTFDVLADKVRFLAPAGGARFEYSNSNIRIYDGAGVMRVRLGVWT